MRSSPVAVALSSIDGSGLGRPSVEVGPRVVVGLVDEVVVKINPALFGTGIGLVSDAPVRADLRLRETRAFDNGVVFLRYGVEGSVG